jgi:hypothetical protein
LSKPQPARTIAETSEQAAPTSRDIHENIE